MPRILAYTRTAVTLHWLVAVGVVAGLALGFTMVDLPFSPRKLSTYAYHKWIGVTVFVLMVVRLGWRLGHPPPPLPAGMPRWQVAAARAVHVLLYGLLLAIPLTGWLYSSAAGVPTVPFGIALLQLPDLLDRNKEIADLLRFVHRSLNYAMAALVALHVGAALVHHLTDHHRILWRMLPGGPR
ncbi:MAG: cytochrome b [Burkholderiales bacterium]|nr:cytochrome b [Burkholderiales bacterium]